MVIEKIGFENISAFSQRDIKYKTDSAFFNNFLSFQPDLDGLKQAAHERMKFKVDRKLIHDHFNTQTKGFEFSLEQKSNISSLLDESTLTITTAHQPSLFGGPLYFVYKIFSVINLAGTLNEVMKAFRFVPVFVIGSEDHDFEEVNHLHLYGKKIEWNHQSGGAVGRYDVNGLQQCIKEVEVILGKSENAKYLIEILESALEISTTYNEFVIIFINKLFGKYGLLVINMDDKDLKKAFSRIMQEELLSQSSNDLVKSSQEELRKLGFEAQAKPREINLFYMRQNIRERIIFEEGHYRINNTELKFTKAELLKELDQHPENFSPNVIMRPMYEEAILPNIAYVGGGGELAYWMERKHQFEHFKIFFPVLIRRNSVMIISKTQQEHMQKLGITLNDLLLQEDFIIASYLKRAVKEDISLSNEISDIESNFNSIKLKAKTVDKSLEDAIEAEKIKFLKQLDQLESRILRAVKKNEEVAVNQIKLLKNKLFPGQGLQERHDNFMQYYNDMGEVFFEKLKENLDPLQADFLVLKE